MSVQFALLAVARTTAASVPDEIDAATDQATAAGHKILTDEIIADSEAAIHERLTALLANPEIDVVLVLAGAESDAASKALKPLITEVLPGFTDLFRWLMFQEAGASAMLSSAEAAQCGSTLVFVLPGAIPAAMEKLILPQFDPKTTPRNLVDKLPRLRTEPGAPREAVPQPIAIEKTQGGSGIHTRLPAIPSGRLRSRTGANIVHREQPTDDPTKPIDLEKLEMDLAASAPTEVPPSDDATRPMDLGMMLPAVPPGADPDAYEPDRDDDHTDVTLAAPPPPVLFPRPMAIPSIAKPAPRANPTGARGISPSAPPRIAKPSTPPSRREFAMTPATPMPVTITPRKKPESAKPAEPAKPLDAKTQAIEAQRAKDATATAEARKRALTPKPIPVTPPKPNEWEQQPATAASKRESGRHAAIVAPDAGVAAQAKNVEPKYGDAARAASPAIAATSGTAKSARRDSTDVDEQVTAAARGGEPDGPTVVRRDSAKPGDVAANADDLDGRPTIRVVPGAAAAVSAAEPEGPTTVRRDSIKPADLGEPDGPTVRRVPPTTSEPDGPTVRRVPPTTGEPDGPTVRRVPATTGEPDGPTVRRVSPTAGEPDGPTVVRRDSSKPGELPMAAKSGAGERADAAMVAKSTAGESDVRGDSSKPADAPLAAAAAKAGAAKPATAKPATGLKNEPPVAHINGAAVHEASDLDAAETVDGMRAVGNSTEALEKIDLIDAADDASPAEIRSVLMKDVAPEGKSTHARPITQSPPPAKRAQTTPPPAAKRAPTTPPPPRASVDDLPRGNFAYPVKKRGGSLVLKLLLAAVILGAGFFAVVVVFRDKESAGPKAPEPTPTPVATTPTPPPVVVPDAAIDEPDIEMDPTPTPPPTTNAGSADPKPKTTKTTKTTDPKPKTTRTTDPKPKAGSNATVANTTPPDAAVAAPVDDDCDETSCVLSKYERACCAKYKPATTDFKPRVGDVPESLDKSMVRAGVERVKPRVVSCGEKSAVKGTVKIALAVAPDGAVTSASIADSPDPALGECVLNAMKSAKFGKTVNGASFTYPFAF